jgi:hypothetical protein
MVAYNACQRMESLVFNALYNGLGGAYGALRAPVDELSYAQPVLHVAASILFAALVFLGVQRRRLAAAAAALLGSVITFAALLAALAVYANYLHAATSCSERSIAAAGTMTAEDQARIMAANLARTMKFSGDALMLDGVEAQGRSVIVRIRAAEHKDGPAGFAAFVDQFRRRSVTDFCNDPAGNAFWHKLDVKRVTVFRYADTGITETVVLSNDQCTR